MSGVEIMTELWKDIEGYENIYQVSNLGRVKSLYRWTNETTPRSVGERILKAFSTKNKKNKYLFVELYKDNKGKKHRIHKLVTSAFYGKPPTNMVVNHIDGNTTNNALDNLEYCTISQNIKHAYAIGLHKPLKSIRNPNVKYTETDVILICKLSDAGYLRSEIAKMLNINWSAVNYILLNRYVA